MIKKAFFTMALSLALLVAIGAMAPSVLSSRLGEKLLTFLMERQTGWRVSLENSAFSLWGPQRIGTVVLSSATKSASTQRLLVKALAVEAPFWPLVMQLWRRDWVQLPSLNCQLISLVYEGETIELSNLAFDRKQTGRVALTGSSLQGEEKGRFSLEVDQMAWGEWLSGRGEIDQFPTALLDLLLQLRGEEKLTHWLGPSFSVDVQLSEDGSEVQLELASDRCQLSLRLLRQQEHFAIHATGSGELPPHWGQLLGLSAEKGADKWQLLLQGMVPAERDASKLMQETTGELSLFLGTEEKPTFFIERNKKRDPLRWHWKSQLAEGEGEISPSIEELHLVGKMETPWVSSNHYEFVLELPKGRLQLTSPSQFSLSPPLLEHYLSPWIESRAPLEIALKELCIDLHKWREKPWQAICNMRGDLTLSEATIRWDEQEFPLDHFALILTANPGDEGSYSLKIAHSTAGWPWQELLAKCHLQEAGAAGTHLVFSLEGEGKKQESRFLLSGKGLLPPLNEGRAQQQATFRSLESCDLQLQGEGLPLSELPLQGVAKEIAAQWGAEARWEGQLAYRASAAIPWKIELRLKGDLIAFDTSLQIDRGGLPVGEHNFAQAKVRITPKLWHWIVGEDHPLILAEPSDVALSLDKLSIRSFLEPLSHTSADCLLNGTLHSGPWTFYSPRQKKRWELGSIDGSIKMARARGTLLFLLANNSVFNHFVAEGELFLPSPSTVHLAFPEQWISRLKLQLDKLQSGLMLAFVPEMHHAMAAAMLHSPTDLSVDLQAIGDWSGHLLKAEASNETTQLALEGLLHDRRVYLKAPLQMSTVITPALSKGLLQGTSLVSISSSNGQPIRLRLEEGSFPLHPFDWKGLFFRGGWLQVPPLDLHLSPVLRAMFSSLLARDSVDWSLAMTPFSFNLEKGVVHLARSDLLLGKEYPIAVWGKIDLLRDWAKVTLALSPITLSRAFGYDPSGSWLQIPLQGPLSELTPSRSSLLMQMAKRYLIDGGSSLLQTLLPMRTTPSMPSSYHKFDWSVEQEKGR